MYTNKLVVFGYFVFLQIILSGTILQILKGPPETWKILLDKPSESNDYFREFLKIVPDGTNGGSKLVLTKAFDLKQIKKDTNHDLDRLRLTLKHYENGMINAYDTLEIEVRSHWSPVIAEPLSDFYIKEDSKPGTNIDSLLNYVKDKNTPKEGLKFKEVPYKKPKDVTVATNEDKIFKVSTEGVITLAKRVDFEKGPPRFALNFTVQDDSGFVAWAVFHISVLNANDNGPKFVLKRRDKSNSYQHVSQYSATVDSHFTGSLSLYPGPIFATDVDNDAIHYLIVSGHPKNYSHYVHLGPTTGIVSITKPITDPSINCLSLVVAAHDGDPLVKEPDQVHSATAHLLISLGGKTCLSAGSDPGNSSESNAFLISTIIVSLLSLIFIVVIITMGRKLLKNRDK